MKKRTLRMTSKDVETLLRRYGFEFASQKGSHRKWRHPTSGLQVVVPEHRGRQLPLGTLHNILSNAKIPEAHWRQ